MLKVASSILARCNGTSMMATDCCGTHTATDARGGCQVPCCAQRAHMECIQIPAATARMRARHARHTPLLRRAHHRRGTGRSPGTLESLAPVRCRPLAPPIRRSRTYQQLHSLRTGVGLCCTAYRGERVCVLHQHL